MLARPLDYGMMINMKANLRKEVGFTFLLSDKDGVRVTPKSPAAVKANVEWLTRIGYTITNYAEAMDYINKNNPGMVMQMAKEAKGE